jgi:putative addiction module component (TIGR02574 family)
MPSAPRSSARSNTGCSAVPTLPLAQRLELVQTLWDSIAAEQIGPELTESERELIDQRLERFLADGDAGIDADEVLNALEQTL